MTAAGAALARRIYQAIDEHLLDEAAAGVAEDVRLLSVPTGDLYLERTGYLDYLRSWITALPDLRMTVLEVVAAEDGVIVEYETRGTQTGPLVTPRGHIPATGMEVHLRLCDVLEIAGDEVVRIRSYWDTTTLMRQLGLLTEAPLHAPDRRASLELYAQAVDGTAPERHKAIVHRFVENVFNRQNPAAAADSCDRDYRWHGGSLGEAKGLAAYQKWLDELFLAFPDFRLEVLDTVAERDRVVLRFSLQGTHLATLHGIDPTYKRVATEATCTYRLAADRIVEEWWQGDLLFLLQRLNAAPSSMHRPS